MRRTRHNKKKSFIGRLLLTVFVNLFLVQLACTLPHLVQRLQPFASTPAHHHNAKHDEHSHKHGHETSSPGHQGEERTDHSGGHAASSTEDADCCAGQEYAPFLKASTSVELPSLVKSPLAFMGSLYQAVLSFLYKSHITGVSYTPPDAPVPKIPDIRIFLHSLTI